MSGDPSAGRWRPPPSRPTACMPAVIPRAADRSSHHVLSVPAALVFSARRGRHSSQKYNREQRRNTLALAVLGQLQRPPAGFEAAIR